MPASKASYAAAAITLLPIAFGVMILGPAAVRDHIARAGIKSSKPSSADKRARRKLRRRSSNEDRVRPNDRGN